MAITKAELMSNLSELSKDEIIKLSQSIDADPVVKKCIDSILGHAIWINK